MWNQGNQGNAFLIKVLTAVLDSTQEPEEA